MLETLRAVIKQKIRTVYEKRANRQISQPQITWFQRFDKVENRWYFRNIKIRERSGHRITRVKRIPIKQFGLETMLLLGITATLTIMLVLLKPTLEQIIKDVIG